MDDTMIVTLALNVGDRVFLDTFLEQLLLTPEEAEALHEEKAEEKQAQKFGWGRHAFALANNLKPHVVQDRLTILSNNRAATMSEFAVARWINVYPVGTINRFLFYNLLLPSGAKVAVQRDDADRACKMDQHREALRLARHKDAPDIYIVVAGGYGSQGTPYFEFVGCCTHAELLASPVEQRGEYKPHWIKRDLHPRLEILTVRGTGYRMGPTTDTLDFEAAAEA